MVKNNYCGYPTLRSFCENAMQKFLLVGQRSSAGCVVWSGNQQWRRIIFSSYGERTGF